MPIPRRAIAALACFLAMPLHAQQKQLSGPVAGYVFDGAALRPIAGVPGGATLGRALALGFSVNAAAVSPQLDSAIVTAPDGSLHLFRLSGPSATEVPWSGVPCGPALVVYSPAGTAAAIYAAGRVLVVGGLPIAPQPSFAAELASPAEHTRQPASAAPQAIAVSDDAAWLLLASEGHVRLLGASGFTSALLDSPRGVSAAFAPNSHTAAVLNGAGPSLEIFPDVAAAPSHVIPAPGLAEPVGLAFSADGKLVLAASRIGRSVMVFDLAAGPATTLDCTCAPTTVARLGNMFRLTDAGPAPVWLLDMSAAPPRIVFVPARANP